VKYVNYKKISNGLVQVLALEQESVQMQPEDRQWWCVCDVRWQFIP